MVGFRRRPVNTVLLRGFTLRSPGGLDNTEPPQTCEACAVDGAVASVKIYIAFHSRSYFSTSLGNNISGPGGVCGSNTSTCGSVNPS